MSWRLRGAETRWRASVWIGLGDGDRGIPVPVVRHVQGQMLTLRKARFFVLIVDDDDARRRTLFTALTASGFGVEVAQSVREAMAKISEHPVDLAILDLDIPGVSGFELCQQLRATLPEITIIMVTARDSERNVIEALEAGADDYLAKPVRLAELVARSHAVLRRAQPKHADRNLPVIRVGDLVLDTDRRRLRRCGRIIHLTPTEFDLLALLMKTQGTPQTHAKLLRAIWGPEYGEELEYLRSYIRMLRKKIEDDPSQPKYLVTEPWVGYRFCNPFNADFPHRQA